MSSNFIDIFRNRAPSSTRDFDTRAQSKDEELLEEIQDRYKQYDNAWEDIRRQRNIDMKYITGDPWHADEKIAAAAKAREDNGRPVMNSDQLSQYVNQCVNSVRENRRGIKVDPSGQGSDDQSAALRQDLIRTIEYDSDAPSIYANASQDMVEGSYAFFRICRRYVRNQYLDPRQDLPRLNLTMIGGPQQAPAPQSVPRSRNQSLFDMEIAIKPIANPNSVLFDPTCKEPDWSDGKACFVMERMSKKEFKRRWPKAQVTSFSWEHKTNYGDWIFEDDVMVAEYWRVETEEKTVYLLDTGEVTDKPQKSYVDKRKLDQRSVRNYITNGVEILERPDEPEPGTIIPIIPMIGLERYVEEGGFSKRVLFSLVRLARDPQMALAYLISQEMEEAGLSPKTPFIGYKGQFDSSRNMWRDVTKIPYAFLESDIPDNWPMGQVPPLPTRVPFTPNFQAYEIAKDAQQRAIQSAMGIMPLPTAAQRAGEKSGVALQRIENEEALGSYHFVDGYDRALRLAGRVIDQWIPAVYGGHRDKHIRKANDSYRLITLNSAVPYADQKTGVQVHYPVEEVDHSISISTGPSFATQREAVSDFLDNLIGQLPKLPLGPQQAAQLLAMALKMKNLGPQGDEMAEIIYPSDGGQNQSAAQLQQAQTQLQQQGLVMQQMQAELQKLQNEKQAKVVEGEYKMATERMRAESNLLVERLKIDAQVAAAEIQTRSQVISERIAAVDELYRAAQQQLHEGKSQAADQQHEMRMAQQEYMAQALENQQQQQPQQPQQPEAQP